MIIKKCEACGKEFKTLPSWIKRSGAKFCSRKCFGISINRKIIKKCLICNKEFIVSHSVSISGKGKYCSTRCYYLSKNNDIQIKCQFCGNNFITNLHEGHKRFCSKNCWDKWSVGKNHWNWKGDDVGYGGLHDWVEDQLGKPTKCEYCGKDGLTGRKIGWANKSGEYLRDLSDWLRLCVSCHREYDHISFYKGFIPWNKDTKGICKAWNKGLKMSKSNQLLTINK